MKKALLIILTIIACSQFIAQTAFQKVFGTSREEDGFSVQQTSDGGYIICGIQVLDSINTDVYMIKTDALGDTSWIKRYGGNAADFGEHAEQTNDGGYIIAGITNSFGAGSSDVYLLKTNSFGDTLWTRAYGGSGSELGQYVTQTNDGGYIIAGHSDTFGPHGDFYIVKTNAGGDTNWTRTYGDIRHDHGYCVKQTSDNGYIIVGHSLSFGASGGFYAVKTNANGDTLWTKGYGGNGNSFCYSVEQTSDGGYIIGGETECFGAGLSDFWAVKTNSSGDTLWTKTYGGTGSDYLSCIKQTPDGGYILVGYTESFGFGGTDVYLVKTNSAGNLQWAKTYGGTGNDEGCYVNTTADGGYIIAGSTKSFGSGGYDIYLIKTDASGNTSCHQTTVTAPGLSPNATIFNVNTKASPTASSIKYTNSFINYGGATCSDACAFTGYNDLQTENININVFPNPTNKFVTVESAKSELAILYNSSGKIIDSFQTNASPFKFDMEELPDGIYLLRIGNKSVRIIKRS